MKRIDAQISFGDQFSANLIVSNLDGTNAITRPMHSFTSNFLQNIRKMVFSYASSTTQTTRKVLNAASEYVPIDETYDRLFYQETNMTNPYHGIILGTGNPTRTPDMVALGAPLNSSSIEYVSIPGYSVAISHNPTIGGTIVVSKAYKNISAAPLSITEIGFTHYHGVDSYALFSHDIYDPPITLDVNQTKRFSIQINIAPTIPKGFYTLMSIMFNGVQLNGTNVDNGTVTCKVYNYGLGTYYNYSDHKFASLHSYNGLGLHIGTGVGALLSTNYNITKTGLRTANTTIPQVVTSGSQTYMDFTNVFINNTENTVSVSQLGIYVGSEYASLQIMPFRYLLASAVPLAPSEQVEVHFKLKTLFT